MLALSFGDVVELIRLSAEDVRRAQNMRQVVVKSKVIVNDAVVDVVRFEQVLQRPCSLLRLGFDLVGLDLGQLDTAGAAGPAGEVGQGWPPDLQHAVLDEMECDRRACEMPIIFGKRKSGDGRSRCNCRSTRDVPRLAFFEVSFGAGE